MVPVCGVLVLVSMLGMADATQETGVSAVRKVVQMLTDMSATAKQEKHDDEVAFAKFETWCGMQQENLKSDVKKAGQEINLFQTDTAKLDDDVKNHAAAIAQLNREVASHEADQKEEEEQRAKDFASFNAESIDLGESIDALDRAIGFLQQQSFDRKGASAVLLQLSNRLPEQAGSVVTAFTEMLRSKEDPDYSAPEANAYEFQSGGIIDMLKKLLAEFKEKLGQIQKEEMNSKHANSMVQQSLDDSIRNKNVEVREATVTKQEKQGQSALKKKQLGAAEASRAEDTTTLSDMKIECEEKRLSFLERQKLQAEEIAAIEEAVNILQSDDVSGNAEKHEGKLVQLPPATAFSQLRSSGQMENIRRHVRDFLFSEGRRLHSKSLELLSEKIASDPFAKVKKLIDDMITRLLEEANKDADHEGLCTKEMGQSKITRTRLNQEVDGLTAAVEQGKATIMQLTTTIKSLTKEVAGLTTARTEATALRVEEKKKNAATVADAEAAQKAVRAATAVLKTFYEKARLATGFIQVERPRMGSEEWNSLANPNFEAKAQGGLNFHSGSHNNDLEAAGSVDTGHTSGMQTFGGDAYKGQQDEAGGVLAMLDLILGDFVSLQVDTAAAENASQKSHDEFMTESQKNIAIKGRNIDMSASDKASATTKMHHNIAELKATQDELLAADRYHAKLVPQCIDKGMTFKELMAARQAEIQSLKQALELLSAPQVETTA